MADDVVKVILLGDFGVGKSSLLLCWTEDKFTDGTPTECGKLHKCLIGRIDWECFEARYFT